MENKLYRYEGLSLSPPQVLQTISRVADGRLPAREMTIDDPVQWIDGLIRTVDDAELRQHVDEHLEITLRTGNVRQVAVAAKLDLIYQFASPELLHNAAISRHVAASPKAMAALSLAIQHAVLGGRHAYHDGLRTLVDRPGMRRHLAPVWIRDDRDWSWGRIRDILSNDSVEATARTESTVGVLEDAAHAWLEELHDRLDVFGVDAASALRAVMRSHGLVAPDPAPPSEPEPAPKTEDTPRERVIPVRPVPPPAPAPTKQKLSLLTDEREPPTVPVYTGAVRTDRPRLIVAFESPDAVTSSPTVAEATPPPQPTPTSPASPPKARVKRDLGGKYARRKK